MEIARADQEGLLKWCKKKKDKNKLLCASPPYMFCTSTGVVHGSSIAHYTQASQEVPINSNRRPNFNLTYSFHI
jgi:hypothetical protein